MQPVYGNLQFLTNKYLKGTPSETTGNRGTFFLFPFVTKKREQKERPPVSSSTVASIFIHTLAQVLGLFQLSRTPSP